METQVVHSPEMIAAVVPKRGRAVPLSERPTMSPIVPAGWNSERYDDVRQLAVVVWARTKLLQQVLGGDPATDPRVLSGLAEIDAAIAAIGARLDAIEDALAGTAA